MLGGWGVAGGGGGGPARCTNGKVGHFGQEFELRCFYVQWIDVWNINVLVYNGCMYGAAMFLCTRTDEWGFSVLVCSVWMNRSSDVPLYNAWLYGAAICCVQWMDGLDYNDLV